MVSTTPFVRHALRILVVGYLLMLIAWPLWLVVQNTLDGGISGLTHVFTDENVIAGLRLTAIATVSSVLINLVFGVTISLLIVRYRFPGKRILSALLDVPLSVSPVVVGLALLLVYGPNDGWLGPWLAEMGVQIIFSTPGIIMATVFVALPLVIRELIPTLEEIGDEQEWAARSLGASGLQTFLRITLPSIKWAVVYGVVLALARSLGEFGAVKVVSGNIVGSTQTATLVLEERYQNYDQATAYSLAFILTAAAVLCIVIVSILRPKHESLR